MCSSARSSFQDKRLWPKPCLSTLLIREFIYFSAYTRGPSHESYKPFIYKYIHVSILSNIAFGVTTKNTTDGLTCGTFFPLISRFQFFDHTCSIMKSCEQRMGKTVEAVSWSFEHWSLTSEIASNWSKVQLRLLDRQHPCRTHVAIVSQQATFHDPQI